MDSARILRKYNKITSANNKRQKPPIPELPKDAQKLKELTAKHFEVLRESEPVSESGGECHAGGLAITDLLLKCPFCGMEFDGVRISGCFIRQVHPRTCPNCNFSRNVFKALEGLWIEKKER